MPRSWVAAVLLLAAVLHAQDLRPTLSGRLTDPSNAAIANAQIEATETATGMHLQTTANPLGRYAFHFLNPGRYTLTVTAPGFRRYTNTEILLTTSEHRALDIQLQLGEQAETVTVTGAPDSLETHDPIRGPTIPRQTLADLPNNGRNIYQLVWAAAGVTKTSTYWGSMENYATGNATNAQINGGVRRENETILDGIANTSATRDVVFQPPVEATEEVRVQTGAYDASYGRFGGGVVAIVTKSGSNAYHGTLFETNKNAALEANPWVLNYLGQPKEHFVNNTFGFQTGGPLQLPGLFFSLAYEGLRERSSNTNSTRVPTAAERAGDLSQLPRTLYDPLTTRLQDGAYIRTPFTNNRIPATLLDTVATNALTYVPQPNLSDRPYPLANYGGFSSARNSYSQWLARLDARLNPSNSLFFSYGRLPYKQFSDVLFGPDSPAEPSVSNPLQRNFYHWVADWTSTLSPNTALDLRAGLTRYVETRGNPAAVGFNPASLGMAPQLVSQFTFLQFPFFNLGGTYSNLGSNRAFLRTARDTWSYQANLHRAAAAHQLHAGTEFRIYNENTRTPGRAAGQYNFTKAFTQADPARADAASGDELAAFLLGYPATGAVDSNIDPAFQGRYYAAFLQDTWRIAPRLTVNLGLRWDYDRPYTERFHRMLRGFDFTQPSPIPNLTGALQFAAANGDARFAYNPDRNNVQPRLGLAWQFSNNWVLRAGYGLFYLGVNGGQPTTGFSQATELTASTDGGNTPRVTLANAFPEGLVQPQGAALGPATGLGQAISFGYLDRVIPYTHQYSVTLQHLFPSGFVVEATYSGNHTRRYPVSAALNFIPAAELNYPDAYYRAAVPNPMAGLLPANAALKAATTARQNLLVAFPQYSSVTMTNIPIGQSNYHSLQIQLTRRYAQRLAVSAAYTISKTLEQLSFQNPQDFHRSDIDSSILEKRLAQFDVAQKFAALVAYDLPFRIQLGAQLTLQSGFPVDFPNAANLEPRSAKLSQTDLYHAFDKTLFPTTAPNLQYTTRTFPTRFPDVRLRPLQNLDLAISKKIRLTERVRIELRSELLNATNHPWFSALNARGTDVTRPEFAWYELEEQNQNRQIALVAKLTF